MDEFNLYPPHIVGTVVQVLVSVFNDDTRPESIRLASILRKGGMNTELYMEDRNLGKQFNYADKKQIPLVAVLGPDEINQGVVKIKRLSDGEEVAVAFDGVVEVIGQMLG
jgi:histidyl-tRNA synthetase